MIFNSLTYLLLLSVVVLLYWILPYRARLLLILLSSLTFYGFWRIEFVPVMMFSVFTDYWVARSMQGKPINVRKYLLWLSLTVNFGLLFYFKYLIFFSENVIGIANIIGIEIDPLLLYIVLPLGISFYTFQTISYTVDVYRGIIKPENDFVLYSCYVTFFPQLVAGPVLRAAEVLHQFSNRIPFSFSHLVIGSRRVLYGLFLKVVLADNIAPMVDQGFSMPIQAISALDVWTLSFLFGFQIYFDFSAYSHIAIGSARMLGICFPENFNFPYLATSPKDFWRRWHISLSSWIRDYLYLPLAGIKFHDRSIGGLSSATSGSHHVKPLFLTWGIMGFWHGANWTFLLWGLYHALIISVYRLIEPYTKSLPKVVRWWGGVSLTLPFMMLAWIPFRAESLDRTFMMWSKVVDPVSYTWLGMRENTYLIAALILLFLFTTYFLKETMLKKYDVIFVFVRDLIVLPVIFFMVFVFFRPINQFIYFQF